MHTRRLGFSIGWWSIFEDDSTPSKFVPPSSKEIEFDGMDDAQLFCRHSKLSADTSISRRKVLAVTLINEMLARRYVNFEKTDYV